MNRMRQWQRNKWKNTVAVTLDIGDTGWRHMIGGLASHIACGTTPLFVTGNHRVTLAHGASETALTRCVVRSGLQMAFNCVLWWRNVHHSCQISYQIIAPTIAAPASIALLMIVPALVGNLCLIPSEGIIRCPVLVQTRALSLMFLFQRLNPRVRHVVPK